MATKEEILESISNMSVMDLVDLISDIEEKFGVTAAAVAAAPAAAHISGGTKLPRAHATLIVEESGHPSLAISKKLI